MESAIQIRDEGIDRVLARIARKGRDLPGALGIIGERILRQTEDRFSKQIDPSGNPWKPLSPATRRHKKGDKILTDSGHLRGSIRYQVEGNVLRVGTNRVYGAIHHFGGSITHGSRSELFTRNRSAGGRFAKGTASGRGFTFREHAVRIPARPYLGISKEDSADIVEVLTDWLEVK